MAKEAKAGPIFQARCTCGKEAAVNLGSFGRPLSCRTCRATYVVVWGIDPKSRKAVPITFVKSGASTRGFKLPPGLCELGCACGQRLYARPRQAGKRVQCPVCGTWLKLEESRDPQTLETRIRVVQSRLNQLPAVPPPPPKAKAEPIVQAILCDCGESLRIESEQLGKQAQCPGCGALIRLEITQDPESSGMELSPRIVGKTPPPERRGIDEEWSLDDFN